MTNLFFSQISEKVNEVVSQQNVGNKSTKMKRQVSGNNNSGVRQKSIQWLVNVSSRREGSREIIKKKKKNLQIL